MHIVVVRATFYCGETYKYVCYFDHENVLYDVDVVPVIDYDMECSQSHRTFFDNFWS